VSRLTALCLGGLVGGLIPALFGACGHSAYLAGIVAGPQATGHTVVLETNTGDEVPLQGDLASELAHVPGAMVRVEGRLRGHGERQRLNVTAYRLLDAGKGVPPHVGKLYWDGTRLLLIEEETGTAVELRGRAVTTLRRQTGAKAWIVGPVINIEILEVVDYGILREAPRASSSSENGKTGP